MEKIENPKRLCSEIQLFDICSKNSCKYKEGRYCTEGDILARFEAISDEEDMASNDVFLADEMEEMDEDELSYDEGVGVDEGEEEPEEEDF